MRTQNVVPDKLGESQANSFLPESQPVEEGLGIALVLVICTGLTQLVSFPREENTMTTNTIPELSSPNHDLKLVSTPPLPGCCHLSL